MSSDFSRRRLLGGLAAAFGALLSFAGAAHAASPRCVFDVDLFDANPAYTHGSVLPLAAATAASLEPLTTPEFDAAARRVSRAAADGVTLLLVRVALAGGEPRAVRLHVDAGPGVSAGALFPVDDARVTDRSAAGGAIDTPGIVGPLTIVVNTVAIGGRSFAFALWRAPRNFDGGPKATATLASRPVDVVVSANACDERETIDVVRPLVVFVHGTAADNDAWVDFPLWTQSANELHGFAPGALPYSATRVSFRWIWNATGGVVDNAATILPQLVRAIRDWREETHTAATQADVVTHSFGGFVARKVVETQPDASPLGAHPSRSFRAAANWGHGSIHKLITLAATHRGAASANATAWVNGQGSLPGFTRSSACLAGAYIDKGALRDQMVLSPALRALGETRVPGHAIAGSGRAALDPSGSYTNAFFAFGLLDSSGPYGKAIGMTCGLDRLANYTFNLDTETPKVTGTDAMRNCSVTPDYDLVVSERSSLGLMPDGASTTGAELSAVGTLNHSAFHDPAYGSAALVAKVSDRVRDLLTARTTDPSFHAFPAVLSVAPSALETRFSTEFDPAWFETGSCGAPSYNTTCPAYSDIQVVPSRLTLDDAVPAPLEVYGLLNGRWVLAWSPGVTSSSRACTVTLTSSDPSVAEIQTNAVTGAQVVVGKANGSATITVKTKNAPDRAVPVEVALGE